MCGIYGVIDFKKKLSLKDLNSLIDALGASSTARGTHATGIAYNDSKYLTIKKRPISGLKFKADLKINPRVVIGHTRFATQGSPKKNINNHPFMGYLDNKRFALTHNGVIYNTNDLILENLLKSTKVDTDSYVIVQLLEKAGPLSIDSLKKVLKGVQASLALSILDQNDDLYLVKGDNPIELVYVPKLGIYIYASTREILIQAILDSTLNSIVYDGEFKYIDFPEFNILKMSPTDHKMVMEEYEVPYCNYYYSRWSYYNWDMCRDQDFTYMYNELLSEGFTEDEAEEIALSYIEEV